MTEYIEPPEGFFQIMNLDRLCNLIPTQGYGVLSFEKREQGFAYYKGDPMCNGPGVIGKETGGEDEYIAQGTHRDMAGIDGIVSGEIGNNEIISIVIDSQEDLDYFNYLVRNPHLAPEEWNGYNINWNYTSPDQMPVHTNRGFERFIEELESYALDMNLEEYMGEYLDAL